MTTAIGHGQCQRRQWCPLPDGHFEPCHVLVFEDKFDMGTGLRITAVHDPSQNPPDFLLYETAAPIAAIGIRADQRRADAILSGILRGLDLIAPGASHPARIAEATRHNWPPLTPMGNPDPFAEIEAHANQGRRPSNAPYCSGCVAERNELPPHPGKPAVHTCDQKWGNET